MNSRFKELRKQTYKRRVKNLFCNVIECEIICRDDLPAEDNEFIKNFYIQHQVNSVELPIYDSKKHKYINIDEVKKQAFSLFKQNIGIFVESEKVCFNFSYEDEYYIIKSNIRDILSVFYILEQKELPLIVYNEQKSAILALYKLEYALEFVKFTTDSKKQIK